MRKINKYKLIRMSLGLTLKQFSKLSEININTWTKLENSNKIKIQAKTIDKLVKNCNVNLEYLIDKSNQVFL